MERAFAEGSFRGVAVVEDERYASLREAHEQIAAELQRQRVDALKSQHEASVRAAAESNSRMIEALRESHQRVAVELEKQRADASKAQTDLTQRQTPQSAEQRQLDQNAQRDVAAQTAAENAPVRPEFHPHLTVRSIDIGDVVVTPVIGRQAPRDNIEIEARHTDQQGLAQSPFHANSASSIRKVQQSVRARDDARAAVDHHVKDVSNGRPLDIARTSAKASLRPQQPPRTGWVRDAVSGMRSALGKAANLVAKTLDGLASFFESLLGGRSEPQPATPHEIAAADHREMQAEKEAHSEMLAGQSNDDMTKLRQESLRQFGREIEDYFSHERDHGGGRER